jgi:hypothetical protein
MTKNFLKEVVVKRYINFLIIMTMFFATTDVFAKWDQKDLKKALKCYEKTLSHDNEGLVISSIRNIMKLMVTYPQLDFSDAKKKLDKLSLESESKTIRYNAYVATNLLNYPDQLKWNIPEKYEDLEFFFENLNYIFDEQIAQAN